MTITASRTSATAAKDAKEPAGLRFDWAPHGSCLQADPDALFVQGAAQQGAKAICQRCPVIAECLADALDNRTEFGVWGGMTERERRAMLRNHPKVGSWWSLFNAARISESRVS